MPNLLPFLGCHAGDLGFYGVELLDPPKGLFGDR